MTCSMLRYIDSDYPGTIIVPMTLVEPTYYAEIIGRLRGEGRMIRHFTLSASPETLLNRLESRGEGRNSWAAAQIGRCLKGLEDEIFEYYVDTEHKSVSEVTGIIMSLLANEE
jgi:hypothetical protein